MRSETGQAGRLSKYCPITPGAMPVFVSSTEQRRRKPGAGQAVPHYAGVQPIFVLPKNKGKYFN